MAEDGPPSLESDALLVATLLAVDPEGLRGACLRCWPGAARDAWLAFFRASLPAAEPIRRVPIHIGEDRLLGSLDLVATLQQGIPVHRAGVLVETSGGFLSVPMAERMPARMRAHLTAVLDTDQVVMQRDGIALSSPTRIGLIALDESAEDEERTSSQLLDRLPFLLDLSQLTSAFDSAAQPDSAAIRQARLLLASVTISDELCESLCLTAAKLGVASIRPSIMAARTARALAALVGRTEAAEQDARTAARLVLAPRATQLPAAPPPEAPDQDENGDDDQPDDDQPDPRQDAPAEADPQPDDNENDQAEENPDSTEPQLDERILAAALAAIPEKLLQQLRVGDSRKSRGESQGRVGAVRESKLRGRPAGVRPGKPGGGIRLNLIETLRAAAPWQSARRAQQASGAARRLQIRSTDLRVTRYKQRTQTTTIFVVDASGSAALNRLAEAKGAVELILADCYVRRDEVGVIAFRGRSAQLLLAPTRSLVRAKRDLAGLPGGGGTPLAAGIQSGIELAEQVRRGGQTPTIVLLTDGCGNVALDGTPGRQRADADVQTTALRLRSAGIATLLIDISNRGQPQAEALARAMSARYVWLPYADAAGLSKAIRTASPNGRSPAG
jgi:magnesium chelatase subunit D